MKKILRRSIPSFLVLGLTIASASATMIPVTNPDFSSGGGEIAALLNLDPIGTPPAAVTQPIGDTGWYGAVTATTVGNLGFHPGIAINQPAHPGVAVIQYDLGVSRGVLGGAPMPEATLWQNLSGLSLTANSNYTFSISLDTGILNDLAWDKLLIFVCRNAPIRSQFDHIFAIAEEEKWSLEFRPDGTARFANIQSRRNPDVVAAAEELSARASAWTLR